MLKVGLTGCIGSGKSTIAKVFISLGIPVYLSDVEAKLILEENDIIDSLIHKFGDDLLLTDGKIDRKKLAARVFNDTEALQWLNGLIHPRVRSHFMQWMDKHANHAYIVQESAIMLETGFYKVFDKIIVVTCPIEQRINRVLSRDNMSRDQVLERMENQWSEELKLRHAHYVINNDDYVLALPQVIQIHEQLIDLSKKAENERL